MGQKVPSGSFADDLVLVGISIAELVLLINAYQLWCRLLGIKLNLAKTQLWFLTARAGQWVLLPLDSGPLELEVRPTFQIVVVELRSACPLHPTSLRD